MGIQGLLPLLSPIHTPIHLRELKGQAVAVDSYVWLHRGAFSCSLELALGRPTKKYNFILIQKRHINYCMKKVRQLQEHGLWPIMVFDGDYLPMKACTESERRRKRESNRQKGLAYLASGAKDKALECFQSCLDVSPRMAYELIQELKKENIEFIVAPYEADAQLAYLERKGIVSAIITEDSDLLVFGCKNVIFKLDSDGKGILIRRKDFGKIKEFRNWTDTRFRQMAILSGCDYLESPPGIGIKKAQQVLLHSDAHRVIKSWLSWGKTMKAPKLPDGYLERFVKAELTFQHQRVFDSESFALVPLTPFPENMDQTVLEFLGGDFDDKIAKGIACGELDPITKLPFDSLSPLYAAECTISKPSEILNAVSDTVSGVISSDSDRMPLKVVNDVSQPTKARLPFPTGTAFKQLFTKKITIKKTLASASMHFKPLFGSFKETEIVEDSKRDRISADKNDPNVKRQRTF